MNARRILPVILCVAALGGVVLNQWRLQRGLRQFEQRAANRATPSGEDAAIKLAEAEARYAEARRQLEITEQKLTRTDAEIAALNARVRQLEASPQSRTRFPSGAWTLPTTEMPQLSPVQKRSWGPEQAVGEPDTLQAGDISTAWAPLEQDGGEEWLKLDFQNSVDIAEVRVRETHNPGAIAKITAFTADGSEVILWEGVEPKSEPPVEMSFTVPHNVNAKSVKVYLDTKRVPGWNEIDAVQLIGREGSQQWAKQASASSTYAEPNMASRLPAL